MADMLKAVGDVFASAIGMVGDVASAIVGTTNVEGVVTFDNPILLLFCVAVPLCGIGVAMFKRLLRSRG